MGFTIGKFFLKKKLIVCLLERERVCVRKPKMFFIRSLLKEYWNLGKAGKKKKKFCVIGFALILLGRIGIIELYALPHKQTNN